MKYPIEIEKEIQQIETIANNWPIKKNISEVVNWVLQFDTEDFELAFRIIKSINVIGPQELNSALSVCYSKLMRQARSKGINLSLKNTMYAAIGGASKSGAMIAYNFRLINELSSANFLDEESIKYIEEGKIDNLVLIDDIIATGDQSSKDLKEIAERVIPLGVKNIFVLTAVGFKNGIKKVQETELAEVFSALEYDERDCVTSMDSKFYDGLTFSQRKSLSEKFSKYKGLGYDGVGALVAFFYNTPNCTVNSVWADAHGWIPLFPRISNVSGIDKHYPDLETAILNPPKPKDGGSGESLTIFVEGKTDEIFFEQLSNQFNNFNYPNVDVISIGPFYSEKLIGSLKNLAKKYVLITEKEEPETGHSKRVKEVVDPKDLLVVDNLMTYFDIDKILQSEHFKDAIDQEVIQNDPNNIAVYLELRLLKRVPPSVRQSNLEILVRDYSLVQKTSDLVMRIQQKVEHK